MGLKVAQKKNKSKICGLKYNFPDFPAVQSTFFFLPPDIFNAVHVHAEFYIDCAGPVAQLPIENHRNSCNKILSHTTAKKNPLNSNTPLDIISRNHTSSQRST